MRDRSAKPLKVAHRNPWVILTIVCLAQFMVVLDATVVNVALPSIRIGLHFSTGDLQWIVTGYTLTFGGFLLLGGRAGDLLGRQHVFLAGLGIFTLASLFNGLAASSTTLIIGRALQGFGGALISPAALSIITTTFEEGAPRNKALGVWSGIAASGAAFGLLIGGALTQAISWRWAFFVNVPVGVATFLLAIRLVPNTKVHGQKGVDVVGAATVTAGLMSIVYALAYVSHRNADGSVAGWTSPTVLSFAGIGLLLLVVFVLIDRAYRAPIVRLNIFRSRSLSGANLAMFLVAGGMFAMFYFLSIFLQGVLGYSPLTTGLAMLPVCFGIGLGAAVASQVVKKTDARVVTCVGLLIAMAGFLLLLRITLTSGYLSVILPALLVMSVGLGLTFVPVTLIATTNVAEDDAGLASGLLNTSQQIGGSLGLAVLATLSTSRTTSLLGHPLSPADGLVGAAAQVDGFRLAFLCGAILLGAGVVAVITVIRRSDVAGIAAAHTTQSDDAAEREGVA